MCHDFKSPPLGPYLCPALVVRSETLGLLHFNIAADDRIEEDQRRPIIVFGELVKLSLSNLRLRDVLRDHPGRPAARYSGMFLAQVVQGWRQVHQLETSPMPGLRNGANVC